MKERPILMSAPMVRAILEGRKTQTRRIVKSPLSGERARHHQMGIDAAKVAHADGSGLGWVFWSNGQSAETTKRLYPGEAGIQCPYGKPGDHLWVITIKDIPGHVGRYGAGDDGHVYRIGGPIPKKLRASVSSGYRRVTLGLGRKRAQENRFVHEAVCSAFYGERPSGRHEVRHLDGSRSNNLPENLDWGTPESNWSDRKAHGRGVRERHHNAKLSMGIAEQMRASGKTAWALAKDYKVSPKTVRNILAGRTWVHTQPDPPSMPRWASRITLELVSVRVERLNDCSASDALAEGIETDDIEWAEAVAPYGSVMPTPQSQYAALWESINGPGSWEANPFVWVIEFKRIKP